MENKLKICNEWFKKRIKFIDTWNYFALLFHIDFYALLERYRHVCIIDLL